jgi:endonuclease YncB( thermonuclease family)
MRKKLKLKRIIIYILAVFAVSSLSAATFEAWGYKISDGDSVAVVFNKKILHIELDGIDCPELEQEFGEEARKFSKSFIYKKKVTVDIRNYDEQDRIIGRISSGGQELSLALVAEGLAWYNKKNGSDKELAKAQKKAKKAKKGLWKQSKPTSPWIFREAQEKLKEAKEGEGGKK